MGGAVFPPCCLTWGQTMVEVMKVRAASFKRSRARTAAHSVLPALQQTTADPHLRQRLLDTPGQVWVGSVSCGVTAHLSWVLVHSRTSKTLLFVPAKTISQSCVSSGGSMVGSSKKQECSRKTSISAFLTMPKPLTVWITTNCGKLLKGREYQITWPASWEICMQVRKQQLELDMEQQTDSK